MAETVSYLRLLRLSFFLILTEVMVLTRLARVQGLSLRSPMASTTLWSFQARSFHSISVPVMLIKLLRIKAPVTFAYTLRE